MLKLRLLITLLLALHVPAWAAQKPLPLIKLYKDEAQSMPMQYITYRLQLNGHYLESGITDETGAVTTEQYQPKIRQEIVADILGFGVFVFVIDPKKGITRKVIGDREIGWAEFESCPRNAGACAGKGFYWIRLLGHGSLFAAEPYTLTVFGKTVEGAVSDRGYIFLPADNPPHISDAITLRFCNGPAMQLNVGTDVKDSSSTMLQSSKAPAPSLKKCRASSLHRYTQSHPSLNRGMPYIFSEWAVGATPTERAEQKERDAQALLREYSVQAAANNDRLAWLGTLPPTWSESEFSSRETKLFNRIISDMAFEMEDLLQFQCKTPAQVGPTPDMDAVRAYIMTFPDSVNDEKLMRRLYAAAAKGNWLAVVQVYTYENQYRREGENRYLHSYRMLQLSDWLHARKIGAVYSEIGVGINASGYGSDNPFYFAALHNSYPNQYQMGKTLERNTDVRYRAIGRKMQACALNALPEYRKYFENSRSEN